MDKDAICFTVFGRPQQKGSKQAFVNRRRDGTQFAGLRDMNPKARSWQNAVTAVAAEEYTGPLLTGPVRLSAVFYFRRPQSHYGTGRNAERLREAAPLWHTQMPDLSKLIRTLEDGMNGVVYRDDRQICAYGDVRREWTTGQERCEVVVEELVRLPVRT